MSEAKEYPRWKYHAEKEPTLAHSAKHEKELGKSWFESPADVKPDEDAEKESKPKQKG